MPRLGALLTLLLTALLPALSVVAAPGAPAVLVGVGAAREEAVQDIVQLTGSVTAAQTANLSPATSGLVTSLGVDAGFRVRAGDVLLELDPELARWQAEDADAAVRAARVSLEDARRRLSEARALAPQRSIAETLVHELAAEVAQDESALQQAEAQAGYRRAILERHRLRAPYDGVIAAKHTEIGEWVVPGDTVLELVTTGNLRIDFPVAEQYLGRLSAGASVSFTSGAASQSVYEGTVSTVVPVTDPGARTFLLRVEPRESVAGLSPGMSVQGQVRLDAGRVATVVPRDAIIRYPDGRVIVWVVENGDGGTVVDERLVTTGLVF
ncbi:MAG: efflux RND transporter periplasmic adaptor subunit, partial [Halioglobus sp.]|nr:efflux RND transporter periplasmic adaptor subunit [Halioglobus sp.]